MVPDWQTNTVYFSRLLPKRMPKLWAKLDAVLKEHNLPVRFLEHTRDIWVRGYCPIQTAPGRLVKFSFQTDWFSYEDAALAAEELCDQLERLGQIQISPIILEGGDAIGCTRKAILSDKVLLGNKDRSKAQLQTDLERLLEVEQCIFIPAEEYDPLGHADSMVRFVGPRLVVMNNYSLSFPSLHQELQRLLRKHRLDVELLPYKPPDIEMEFMILKLNPILCERNYANFLRIGDLILVPAYGQPEDEAVCRVLERVCPAAKIVPVEVQELAPHSGAFNYISWTVQIGS